VPPIRGGGDGDKRSNLPSRFHPFPSLTLVGRSDRIAKYVAERQRHASCQSLGHRDASHFSECLLANLQHLSSGVC
jgi:hypothetical protein